MGRPLGVHPSIWRCGVPLRVEVFGSLAVLEKIPTVDHLKNRRMLIINAFPLCLYDVESVNHLLLHYPFASLIWSHFI